MKVLLDVIKRFRFYASMFVKVLHNGTVVMFMFT